MNSLAFLCVLLFPLYAHGLAIRDFTESPTPVYAHNASLELPSRVSKRINMKPTPDPTGPSSRDTTVYINSATDFAILTPKSNTETVAESEADAIAFCHPESSGTCSQTLPYGFVAAAAVQIADDNSYIQVTGCIDPSKFGNISEDDHGGQYDVRFPNGAQCDFGGYGASFIQLLEPATHRFCLKCCSSANDQVNCNSHNDRAGCENAIPGTYDFPELGVSCS